MKLSRVHFAMPSSATFSIAPIREFVLKYLNCSVHSSVDPFARNEKLCGYTNDLDCTTTAASHLDAADFLQQLKTQPITFDFALFDPPYSPRQIAECYNRVGRTVGRRDTQNAALYKRVRDALDLLIMPGGMVLSFGWSTNGMGKKRGYEIEEILLVAHGGAHNDTICMAERKCAS